MKAIRTLRLTTLLVASAATVGLWASAAQATTHSLSGNVRLQIGNGLPIPITTQAIPDGRVFATPAATVMQPTPGNGQPITIQPGAFTAPGNAINLPVFLANSNVFQVRTAIPILFPQTMTGSAAAPPLVFSAGKRTGGMTENYCAGSGATPPFNCASANVGFTQAGVNGIMRYTATKNQFGGPARGNAGGSADVALRIGGSPAPCAYNGGANPNCRATMALATPQPTGAQGAPFGVIVGTAGMAPPSGKIYITATAQGGIANAVQTNPTTPQAGLPNPATSFGGPWTTGMLTVSVTNNVGPSPEMFILSGSDARAVNGAGAMSLVAGSVSARLLSGPNANRGWLNMQIGAPSGAHVPVMPIAGLAAFGALAALTGGYALRKRNS
jgi:hypothetical protein